MAVRLAAATDGTTLLDNELGAMELSANTVMQLTQRDSNTRVYCAHGWSDIERLATDLFRHCLTPRRRNPMEYVARLTRAATLQSCYTLGQNHC